MKIAHISDLHLNSFFRQSNLKNIKYLIKYALKEGFDHMVITGDLTNNAQKEDFDILRKMFIHFGLLRQDRLTVIPGNHDIFGGVQTAEDILSFPGKCSNTDYDAKINEFVDYFSETFNRCIYKNEEKHFPFAKLIDSVLITGLNSNARYSMKNNPFASNGEVDIEQFNEFTNIMTTFGPICTNRIVLIHHYFNKINVDKKKHTGSVWQNIEKQTMKLRKKKRLLYQFNEQNVDLVLHGHLHESKEYYRKGIRFMNAGASILENNDKYMQINFARITADSIKTEIHRLKSDSSRLITTDEHYTIQPVKLLIPEPEMAY
jgi:3',5'-cyclic AMP phosphodiesterase CpdA